MSSLLRRIAQSPAPTPARTRYFLAIQTAEDREEGVTAVVTGESVESVMTEDAFNAATEETGISITSGHLYQDLGREVVVYNATTGAHTQKWRQIRHVNGSGSEGVGGVTPDWDSNILVLVWSADATVSVPVVRTG